MPANLLHKSLHVTICQNKAYALLLWVIPVMRYRADRSSAWMQKWPVMGRPISFWDSTAVHLFVVAYTPGDWKAANWREGVASMPFFIRITVVALAVTRRSLPSNGQLIKSCEKIALYGKNCALHQRGPNCGKIVRHKIAIFWGTIYLCSMVTMPVTCTVCETSTTVGLKTLTVTHSEPYMTPSLGMIPLNFWQSFGIPRNLKDVATIWPWQLNDNIAPF